jgi:hypothetical protein
VLQQSISYGDYTAQLVTDLLYDPATNTLKTEPLTEGRQKALSAMRANPTLARNVILLAMRRTTEAALDGAEKARAANYRQTYYGLAHRDLLAPGACGTPQGARKLGELFPNWTIEHRVTAEQAKVGDYSKCRTEYIPDPKQPGDQPPGMGSGPAVAVGDFYVLLPSPLALSTGTFEQADSLRLALAYRDRVSQAIIDRNIAQTVRSQRDTLGTLLSENEASKIAMDLLNEGWGWRNRPTSN